MKRPPVSSSSSASFAAWTAAAGTGPSVPALRYARRSRTGNSERKAAGSMPRNLTTADGPGRAALLRVEHRRAAVLLGLGGGGRIAGAADRLPGGLGELVLAVEAVARVGRRVPARLAGGDR